MKKYLYLLFSFILLTIATATSSYACSCVVQKGSIQTLVGKAYKDSSAVFSGEVLDIKDQAGAYSVVVRFKVNKSYKGQPVAELRVNTGRGGGDCGYPFKVGEKYLVYTYGKATESNASICSRTALLADNRDFKILQKKKNRKS